ncbi:MarR family winged helix-turn-helix transcriptional regulator [Phytoactinopolyspora halotolerans]|uniref:Winged helix-turn-helix transcriptional regulator n=1 Tax=Phytoactinopolyspora halotolerans TaxID=1981512 RepID=A0A6L9S4H1_9ACTN|nr:MarR family winged helix-turn-helix transcriptional regulator [Phytoactinopolyspora halotolerans]NEE00036.1 winged helix-turn-helix transcriptional regulator [Phytoactinopolyspora halotolerans]
MAEDVYESIVDHLRCLVRLSRTVAHRHVAVYEGLSVGVAGALGVLAREGAMRLTTLAERQAIDTSVASRQVAELVAIGLVERVPDPDDARAQLLVSTSDGAAMAERIRCRQVEIVADVLRPWTRDDAIALEAGLARLKAGLRELVNRPAGPAPEQPPEQPPERAPEPGRQPTPT